MISLIYIYLLSLFYLINLFFNENLKIDLDNVSLKKIS